jgi:hypothetical protein
MRESVAVRRRSSRSEAHAGPIGSARHPLEGTRKLYESPQVVVHRLAFLVRGTGSGAPDSKGSSVPGLL